MRRLRKPTTIERTTVDLQAKLIVSQDDGPPGTLRRVRLTVPPAPPVVIGIDVPTPDVAGPGRAYQYVLLPSNFIVSIWLQPQQTIYAAVQPGAGGFAELGYICEFFDED